MAGGRRPAARFDALGAAVHAVEMLVESAAPAIESNDRNRGKEGRKAGAKSVLEMLSYEGTLPSEERTDRQRVAKAE
mgnify:CR=1 FL=1